MSIGHNEHGRGPDVFGQYAKILRLRHPSRESTEYRYRGNWEAMRVTSDSIPIKGERPESVELKYTRHGPVLFEDRANRKAYALRAGWMEPGGAPYLASLRMNQATTWEEFKAACTFNNMPSENMVWVDRKGNIGWQAAGIQPIRRNWSGVLPVPGDGRYEWDAIWIASCLGSEPPRLHRHGEQLPTPDNTNIISASGAGSTRLVRRGLLKSWDRDACSTSAR